MKLEVINGQLFVELTRRNLETLLMKLDLPAGESECTISTGDQNLTLYVKAVEDDEHYSDRPAGMVHPREERRLTKPTKGIVWDPLAGGDN